LEITREVSSMKTIFFSVLCALAAAAVPAGAQTSAIVSGSARPSATGGGGSYQPVLSPDGRFVAFVSQANNLVTNDNLAPYLDVFVRDLANNRTTLVSVNSSGIGGGDGNSNFPTISSNGQFIAFESAASNLAGADTNGASDVFARDLLAATTTLISVSTNGLNSGNGPSSSAAMTPDGRWIVFQSAASG